MRFDDNHRFVTKFRSKIKRGFLDDVDIKCKDGKVRCNRMLLSIYSEFLAETFAENPDIVFHPILNNDRFGLNLPQFSQKETRILIDIVVDGDFVSVDVKEMIKVEKVADFLGFTLRRGENANGFVQLKALFDSERDDCEQEETQGNGGSVTKGNSFESKGAADCCDERSGNDEIRVNARIDAKSDDSDDEVLILDEKNADDDATSTVTSNRFIVNNVTDQPMQQKLVKKEPVTPQRDSCMNDAFAPGSTQQEKKVEFMKNEPHENDELNDMSLNDDNVNDGDNLILPHSPELDTVSSTTPIALPYPVEVPCVTQTSVIFCGFCDMKFKNAQGLKIHIGRRHKRAQLKKEMKKPEIICNCGLRFPFNAKFRIFEHQKKCNEFQRSAHKCYICQLKFKTTSELTFHKSTAHNLKAAKGSSLGLVRSSHSGNESNVCKICNTTLHSWRGLKTHMGHVHKQGSPNVQSRVKCACGQYLVFNNRSRLLEHRKKCEAFRAKAQICGICDKPFQTVYALKHHKYSAHRIVSPKNMCVCGVVCENDSAYRQHCIQCEQYRKGSWICDDCSLPFECYGSIKQHLMATNHKCKDFQENDELRNPNAEVKLRFCKCGEKFGKNDRDGYKAHRENCAAFMATAVICDICFVPFEDNMCLKNHKYMSHGILVGQNTCICGEQLLNNHQYRSHVVDCELYKSRAFSCAKCQTPFGTQHHLNQHVCKLSSES